MTYRRQLQSLVLAVVWTFACGGSTSSSGSAAPSAEPTPQGTVTQTDTGCTLTGVAGPMKAGYVSLNAVNKTSALAGFDMWRITEPNTYQDLVAYVAKEKDLAAAGQGGLGHPSFVSDLISAQVLPSKTGTLYGSVRQGTYAIVCLGPTGAGTRPLALVGPIQVQ